MPGFFARIKNWIGLDNLTAKDLDSEFNNILTNLSAPTISGASGYPATLAGMQALKNPGGIGTEVLPVTIQDEVRELRYMIEQIVGGVQWYAPVPNSLTGINNVLNGLNPTPNNRLISGRVTSFSQPDFLVPAGTGNGNSVTLKATAVPLDTFINNAPVNFSADIILTGLTKGPSSSNTCVLLDAAATGQQSTKTLGEIATSIQIGTIGSNITSRSGTYVAFQTSTEVFFGEISIANTTGSVTFTNATPTVVSYTAHPFVTNDQVTFTGGSLPSGVTGSTLYFVTVIDANSFYISATSGGSFINTTGTGSGTAQVLKSNVIRNCFRGWFFDNNDAAIARVPLTNGATITLLELAWIFATNNVGVPGLDVTYNAPTVSAITPGTPAIGDYWLDLNVNQWKKYSGSSFTPVSAVALGIAATNTADTVAARSFDFNELFSNKNTFQISYVSASQVRASKMSDVISVYGFGLSYPYSQLTWDTSANLDTGVTLSASTNYYCYLSPVGQQFISDQAPNQRKYDLLGDYHPNKPWRCVAVFTTDGSMNIVPSSISISAYHQQVLPYSFVENAYMAPGAVTGGPVATQSVLALLTVQRQNMAPLGQIISGSSGAYSTSSATPSQITNFSLTIQTTGRPVLLSFQAVSSAISGTNPGYVEVAGTNGSGLIVFLRDGTPIGNYQIQAATSSFVPSSVVQFLDTTAAGTHVYTVNAALSAGSLLVVSNSVFVAYEL